MNRSILSFAVVLLATTTVLAQPGNQIEKASKPKTTTTRTTTTSDSVVITRTHPYQASNLAGLIPANDRNSDGRLNADECPPVLRHSFASLDRNHDGYLDLDELTFGLVRSGNIGPVHRGKAIADVVYTVADDFVVDIWHNGVKVPDSHREMIAETYGATDEKIHRIDIREGDWLVFNVVNNRLRWGGVSYFAVAGMKPGGGVAFASEPGNPQWSYCDEPALVDAFIADPAYLANQAAKPSHGKWERGDPRMNSLVDGWKGTPVWGNSRNTWIKYVTSMSGAAVDEKK